MEQFKNHGPVYSDIQAMT